MPDNATVRRNPDAARLAGLQYILSDDFKVDNELVQQGWHDGVTQCIRVVERYATQKYLTVNVGRVIADLHRFLADPDAAEFEDVV